MDQTGKAGARVLLRQLARHLPTIPGADDRLAAIPRLVATHLVTEVCSIYLMRDAESLELSATEGLRADAVGRARLRVGEGLVGRVAAEGSPVATDDAPNEPGFRYIPEIGEEPLQSFLGVPIRRTGRVLGVLVIQNRASRRYPEEDLEALELVAFVIAEMVDAGQVRRPVRPMRPYAGVGVAVSAGFAIGTLVRSEPEIVVTRPIADDPEVERGRLQDALRHLRENVDRLVRDGEDDSSGVLHAYRMVVHDRGWMRRIGARIDTGLSAEAAVEAVQTELRAQIESAGDAYLRDRLRDLDDLAARLMRALLGLQGPRQLPLLPAQPILVARDLSAGELIERGRGVWRAIALEGGSTSSHAAVMARALDIPMLVQVPHLLDEAEPGDPVVVDADTGRVHIRPAADVMASFRDRIALRREAQAGFRALRDLPAESADGIRVRLELNAGLLADMAELGRVGGEGVGLYRTELQFLASRQFPRRDVLTALYGQVLDEAGDRPVAFRTLDVGSDKLLPGARRDAEPNPALGLRGIRFGLARPYLLRMQLQALLRAAHGRALRVTFPMVADGAEFEAACAAMAQARATDPRAPAPRDVRMGAMLETPSLADADDRFFGRVAFVSVGGNDLQQFFFAADRGNERARQRYATLHGAYLRFLRRLARRCRKHRVPLSFCGEAAGFPEVALVLAALGFDGLSMRPGAIGPVKQALRAARIGPLARELDRALESEADGDVPARLQAFLRQAGWVQGGADAVPGPGLPSQPVSGGR